MSREKLHMKIKRIFCGVLAAGMLLGQTGAVWAEATDTPANDTAASSPTPTPDPHTEYYAQEADTDSIQGWPVGPKIEAQAAVLMDLNTEAVLYSKNADTQLYPASITKLLTCLLGCENLDINAQLTLSQQAAYGIEAGSSTIYGDAGEVFTVEQCLMALMLESANEMALGIGEEVSGSVKKFVELMNTRAAQLGCKNTHFNNPNGLPDPTHVTTASDMAKIAKAAWQNPLCRKFFTTDLYNIPPTNIFNRNPLPPEPSQDDGRQGLRLRWCPWWKNRLHRCRRCYLDHLRQTWEYDAGCRCPEFRKRCMGRYQEPSGLRF
ncbi:MAG: D-alanyl-D-alanine carboxypeptidase family protein [Ruminococcus sp.]